MGLLGIIIQQAKAYWLIAGYNTMPSEKKKKVNIEKVAIAIRNSLLLIGVIWVATPFITELFEINHVKIWVIIIGTILVLIPLLIVINISKKYRKSD